MNIAKENNVEVIEIIDGYTTASLGRYLGTKYAKYEDLLFIDSDMELDENWFNDSFEYYVKYAAITGERHEKEYKNNILIYENPFFYNIKSVEIANNVGGCFMINIENLKGINFTPILKEEEERDFFAKFLDKQLIYKVPIKMFIHNNYNLASSRLKSYFYPYNKIGYILSFFSSIKNGYFNNYLKLQKTYINSIVASCVFYYFILFGPFILSVLPILFLYFVDKKYYKGSIMTMFFFPYKLIASIVFLAKRLKYSYVYQNKSFTKTLGL